MSDAAKAMCDDEGALALRSLLEAAGEIDAQVAQSTDPLDAVEGRRFLLRMLAASVDLWVEHGDVDHPVLTHAETPSRKMFADCPDADYLRASIALGAGRVYRLWGRVPDDAVYVGVLLYRKGGRVGNRMTLADLDVDAEGRFEVRIATESQPGVWLRGDGDEISVMVRQYFTDRSRQAPIDVHIELVTSEVRTAAPLRAKTLATGINRAERMLRAVFARTVQTRVMASQVPANAFVEIPGDGLFPTPDNVYRVARFALGEGETLLIRGRAAKAPYYGIALYNPWLESLDYTKHRISLNHTELQYEADGSFEVAIADGPTEHPNGLQTAGHRAGYIMARALLPEDGVPPLTVIRRG